MAKISDRGLENREIILGTLTEVLEKGDFVHLVLNQALQKYQYLDKPDRAFITRVTEGTLEYLLQIDHIINRYSKTRTEKVRPLIRNLLRMSVYQTLYMDKVPDSTTCDKAVKLAAKRRFSGLKGFVNGVLRTVSRGRDSLMFDTSSLAYSIPQWVYSMWGGEYGRKKTGTIATSFLKDGPTWIRCNLSRASRKEILESLASQGVAVTELPWLESMISISGYDYLENPENLQNEWIQVQDVTSALISKLADSEGGDYIIDVCAAPGGKSLHLVDKLRGMGTMEAGDLSEQKVAMIEENMARFGTPNIKAMAWDALMTDEGARGKADIVIADLPYSGLGIVEKEPDIKYNMTMEKVAELASLQREILAASWEYVKPSGTLVYSIRTIDTEENEESVRWLLSRLPLEPVDLTNRVGNVFDKPSLKKGMIQFLPGIHPFDGFFISMFRRE